MTLIIPPKDIEAAVETWIGETLGDEVSSRVKSFTFEINKTDGSFDGCRVELE